MIVAETERLLVRNWQDGDLDLFHHINSDEDVMAFFPMRRNRAESAEMMRIIAERIATTGYGFFALQRKGEEHALGFAGLAIARLEPALPEGSVEIGWRLARRYWGKGYATEAARELLRLGFAERGLEEIVSFAVADNRRSTAVMERIGMTHDPSRDFDHPRMPDSHPHLKRHVLYAIGADEWRQRA